jgi:hypothetical protein
MIRLFTCIVRLWLIQWFNAICPQADPVFDQISVTTLADLREDIVIDNFFVDSTLLRKMRLSGALDEYAGGTIMQTPFQYQRVNGGAIAPGSDITVMQKQILAATGFVPKEYVEQIPVNLWQVGVINSGPAAKVKIIDAYMTNAVQSLNTDLGIDIYRHGQANSGTAVTNNRVIFINGISEALNDGVNNSWDGNVFVNYGGQNRNGAVGNTLNSVPTWVGTQTGATGQITYKPLVEAYLNCVQEPDLGVCNKALYAYLLERLEPKQRYAEEQDVNMGMVGIRVMNALIMVDKLCPSTKYGTILPSGLSQTTAIKPSTFTSATLTSTQNAISNLPSATTINPGEPFFWLRTKGWKVRPTTDPEYNFNFTPWIRSQTNPDNVVGFFKAGLNVYCVSPRDNWQLYGAGF